MFVILEFTDTFLTAQALVFFAAGFETSSTTMSNAMLELALNPDIQKKLRLEINEEIERNEGKITYDGIKNMKYLDKIFKGDQKFSKTILCKVRFSN